MTFFDRGLGISMDVSALPQWHDVVSAGVGGLLGIVGTVVTAMVKRKPLAEFVDARIKIVIDAYESQAALLQAENERLEKRVTHLEILLLGRAEGNLK
jgi:hypothetical protein